MVRILARAAVGFGETPMSGGVSVLVFEAGFLLAGTVLPLALVHGWGRRIPRWLVLGPAIGVSAGIVVYFGLMLAIMVAERLQGRNPFPPSGGLDLPEVFSWFAVPGYVVWGAAWRSPLPCAACARVRPANGAAADVHVWAVPDNGRMSSEEQTFYDAIGGHETITLIVDRFYEGVAADPVLRALYPEEDLEPAARRFEMFLEQYWGG
ncbi:MAG: hypothetical protein ACRDO7_00845, partial [Nocardioidaceae bacterium]